MMGSSAEVWCVRAHANGGDVPGPADDGNEGAQQVMGSGMSGAQQMVGMSGVQQMVGVSASQQLVVMPVTQQQIFDVSRDQNISK